MALTSGTKLGAYEIQSPLGAGGMGEVYRATDTKLGRDVALKVLPAEMAHDPERLARFRREAKSLAQLDHPNIVTIYSVEESNGVHFLTMQLVDGQPLDRVIPQNGLSLERIVEIGSALAEALAAAHEKGIVHRDLKPANVMVRGEGRIKVLDFGLAKDIRGSNLGDATLTSDSRTQVGVVMGTPAYMSPEQTSARPLDHRTDIFSLGVVLHEMATGRRPFEGSSSAELVSAILRDTPPPVTDQRPDLPSDLGRIIRRCLEKDPRHRLQTARDVSNEFRDLARTATRPTPVSTSHARAGVTADSGAARAVVRAEEGFWVAVLPFKYGGGGAELAALAEGLSEEIVTGLSRFSYLRVIARSSTSRYAGQAVDVRNAGKELNARYVMEGTLRLAGSRLRLAVQLIDTVSGSHLWAENYERGFSPEVVFELQDDLVPRIVSTVADMNGVLPRSMSEGLRSRPPEQLSPYEAVLRSFAYPYSATPEELGAARSGLEEAVRRAPGYADAWAMLSFLCGQDYVHGYGLQTNALEIAASAARQAVALGPSNHLAYFSLASVLWYQKDFDSFRDAAERAIALNPMDGNSVAYMGELLVYTGSAERGMQLADRAKQLNPNHPGWYWYADFYHAFSQGDYRGALAFALKVKLRGNPLAPMMIAAACGQLGDVEGGAKAADDLLKFRPELPALMRKQVAKVWNAEYGERFLEGLRKAGLEILSSGETTAMAHDAPRSVARTDSGAARADEGFWVAVLPFKCSRSSADMKALADGLSEETVAGLSRFSYLRVITSASTQRYADKAPDLREVGKELGARYVISGKLRQVGGKLRVAVQLADATSGAQLWSETYERPFSSEAIFELQDDLVPRIVSTVADMHGALPRSMSAAVQFKATDQLTPYEALLRGFGHSFSFSGSTAAVESCLQRAVQQSPANADCLAMLACVQTDAYGLSDSVKADTIEEALLSAQAAVAAAPTSGLAYHALAKAFFFQRNVPAFRAAAERAISLNAMDGATIAYMGILMAFAGDWERGNALTEKGMQLNANHPGWHAMTAWHDAYRRKDYPKALELALKLNAPKNPWVQRSLTVSYAQLGRIEEARNSLRNLLALVPNYARVAHEMHSRWLEPELVEHMMDGLRKAGLEVGDEAKSSSVAVDSGAARAAVREDEGFWVAVLPFKAASGDADLEALADGLSEDVTTGLSRFPYLQVIAHNSAMAYKGRAADIRTVGGELGARYVVEASIRKRGRAIRVSAQLMDAASGTQLWAEAYDREIHDHDSKDRENDAGTFQIQDDLTDHIVTAVADGHGVLVRSMAAPTRDRKVEELSASELVLRYYAFMQQVNLQEHAALRAGFERVLEREPNHATAWACLSNLYVLEYGDGFNPQEKPMERAREAAWRAVKIDPACQMGWKLLAVVHFFSRDFAAFRETAERAMALNPRDGTTLAYVGIMMAYSGDWERGVALVQRAMDLNRHHPGWYYNASFAHHYRKGEYEAALLAAKKINMPEYHWTHLAIAAACGMLGRHEEARTAIESLRKYNPTFLDVENVREEIARWDPDKDEVERLIQGLQKAGLKCGMKPGSAHAAATMIQPELKSDSAAVPGEATDSGGVRVGHKDSGAARAAVREDEGFWVAVLPFKYTGSNEDLKALAEGLSEEVITGLSRFSYLRVIARGSTAKYSSESGDVRAIGKELGARYVIEGSLRQAGSKLRVAVQLADTVSGAHLWAETYEHTFTPESVFEVQDNLVPRIVSTVADQYGVLPRTMSETLRSKRDDELTPHEAVLRTFSYFSRIEVEEHAILRKILERAVREAPDHADSWAMLSMIYRGEFAQGFNAGPNPLDRALAAAQRAVELAPTHALGHYALATVHFFRKEKVAFRVEVERALGLNPLDASVKAYLGLLISAAGEWDRGCQMVESAMQLNPNCPGYFYFARCWSGYRLGKYEETLEAVARINMPGYFHVPAIQAAALGQLGRHEEARKAVQGLLGLRPDFAATARQEYAKWYDDEDVEQVIDGLRKAGLQIPDDQKQSSSGPVPVAPSIAVLPFANMSGDKEQDYFSDGLAEEIINLLAQVPGLKVIARTSAFAFRGKEQDIRGIAETLGVRTVLEGSVRRSGSRIRVTAQLINAVDGSHLWSERYDRELRDIFAVQDEISAAIAKSLRVKLSREAAPSRHTPKLEAYEAYLKAKYQQAKVTPESMELARHYYEKASELDPAFAMPHVGLGFYWYNLAHFGRHFARECVPPARAEAQWALQIDPSLPEAHALLGYIAAMYDLDWAAAEKHFDSPTAKEVGFGLCRPLYGWCQFWQGNADLAIQLAHRAIEADPLEVWTRMNLHAYLQGAGRGDEALEQLKKVVDLDPNQVIALVSMAMIYADKSDLPQALQSARRAYAIGPWSPDTIGILAGLARRNGEKVDSSLLQALGSGEAPGDARAHALFHLLCGEIDQGADWAEKAIEQRDSSMMLYLRFVVCKGLRASHRWPKIAKMVNLPA